MINRVHVKICGLTSSTDALSALSFGADRLGFIGVEGTPRYISPARYTEILAALPQGAETVVVVRDVRDTLAYGAQRIQYYTGNIEVIDFATELIPVIRPRNVAEAHELVATLPARASAVLVDAYHAGALGGTGETGDWSAAAEVVRATKRQVYLAGGLTVENVAEAIATVRPYGVDISSGVEASPGVKDAEKVRAFIAAVRAA